jgi:hypothetical protein
MLAKRPAKLLKPDSLANSADFFQLVFSHIAQGVSNWSN